MATDQKKTLLVRHTLAVAQTTERSPRYRMESIETLRQQLAQEKKAREALQTSVVALQNR